MLEQLLETWEINNKVNLYLLENISEEGLRVSLSKRGGRNVAQQFAHIHNVRFGWLEVIGKELAADVPRFEKGENPSSEKLKEYITLSGKAIHSLIEDSWNKGGKLKGFKRGLIPAVGYFIAHDSHHRGSILLTLKQCGHMVEQEVQFRIWEWDKI